MKKKFILSIAVIVAAVTSCKKLDDLNVNEKAATKVPSETLFANGLRNLVDQITTPSNNFNVLRLFTQYWAGVTYIDETKYDLVARPIPANEFITVYRDVLADLKESKRVIATESSAVSSDAVKKNKTAITEIVSVYAFHREVNIFGNIPYEEALDPDKINPKYDNAQSIYAALFSRLDAAIASIDVNAAGFSKASDLLYGGDMKKWKLFAAGLKVKMAICVADVPSLDPGGKITSAMATGLFTSSADNAAFAYASSAPNTNPVWANIVAADRRDWVAANTIVDIMNNLSDPRRSKFFADNIKDGAGNPKYVGGVYGSQNGYTACTQMSPTIQLANRKANLLEFAEVQFYLAEAAARGFIPGSPDTYYNKAIETSILDWGGTPAEVTAYLLNPLVAYATAAGTYKQKIGTQSYIAFYDRGEPAWNNWRRLDFPIFNPPKGMTQADIPVRYIYPGVEQTLNGANYTEAAAAIGGDFKSTKLFWDKF
jgi:hypothetical protein